MAKVSLLEYRRPRCLNEKGEKIAKSNDDYFIRAVESIRKKINALDTKEPYFILPKEPINRKGISLHEADSHWLVCRHYENGDVASQAAFFSDSSALEHLYMLLCEKP